MKYKYLASLVMAFIIGFAMAFSLQAQEAKKADGITWVKYDEGLKLAAKNNRPILVDFYTDWCGFCKKMDKMTYTDTTVSRYMKDHIVAVKVNGESKEAMNLPDGPMNGAQLSRSFSVTGYPTTWFLDPSGKRIDRLVGFVTPDKLIHVLRYFGDGHYKTEKWNDYYLKAVGSN